MAECSGSKKHDIPPFPCTGTYETERLARFRARQAVLEEIAKNQKCEGDCPKPDKCRLAVSMKDVDALIEIFLIYRDDENDFDYAYGVNGGSITAKCRCMAPAGHERPEKKYY